MGLLKSKIIVLILFIFGLILLLEGISGVVIQSRYQGAQEFISFLNKYVDKVNHVRFFFEKNTEKKPSDLLFSTIRDFESNQTNILIQGDSWGEQIENEKEWNAVSTIAEKNEFGVINGGIGSYSPSLMRAQLQILRNDFNIQPSHVLGLIDNSDMGDELCRYKNKLYIDQFGNNYVHTFSRDEQNEVYALWHFMRGQNLFHSESFDLTKLVMMTINSVEYRIRDRFAPQFGLGTKCRGRNIIEYMVEGVSQDERLYLMKIINGYIEEVFNGNVNNLTLVTHPHKGHVSGDYKFSINEIVKDAIYESEFRDKIKLIDFSSEDLTIFKDEGCGCHVNEEYFSNIYIPNIFENIIEVSSNN
jgi:hypothetical protein